jgi:plastocyanin
MQTSRRQRIKVGDTVTFTPNGTKYEVAYVDFWEVKLKAHNGTILLSRPLAEHIEVVQAEEKKGS